MLALLLMEMVVLNLPLIQLGKPFLRLQIEVIQSGFRLEIITRII